MIQYCLKFSNGISFYFIIISFFFQFSIFVSCYMVFLIFQSERGVL